MLSSDFINKFEFFGIVYALILIAGLYQIGSLIFKLKPVKKIISEVSEIKYQKIFISVNFILIVFYPLILYSKNINFISLISLTLFCFGLFKIASKLNVKFRYRSIKFNLISTDRYLVLISIFGLILLSLSPNTHGDSLGYHFVIAKKLLLTGNYSPEITHYHTFLGGAGEILISVGLFFGSEQFGGLIQFSGLISIFGIFKKINNKNKYYYLLLAITSPIILFLSSTAKPQLFHISSSTVIFSLFLFGNLKHLNSNEQNWKIVLSLMVLIVSVNAKFNFLTSSFLIGSLIFYKSILNKKFYFFLVTSILLFVLFYFPIIYWKYLKFGGSFHQYLYSPIPLSIPGLKEFSLYLVRFGREVNYLNFIFPKNFSQFTNVIGISIFYIFLLNLKNDKAKLVFFIVFLHMLINYLFGQFIGRSLLEPLFWILLTSANYGHSLNFKPFEYFCRLQSIIFIIGVFYGVVSIFPGSLSKFYKDKVLSQNASGYSLFKWANSVLKDEDVVISYHKSISFGKSNYISPEFSSFLKFNNKNSKIIYDDIINKHPKLFLTWGYYGQKPNFGKFEDCVGKLKYSKDSIGRHEARNPFNRGNKYNGYIYEFKVSDFPNCLKKD
tara:strand:+ start:98 stop:1927 length:1830 start_codon:yes stop_codon:yes gene_type:complete